MVKAQIEKLGVLRNPVISWRDAHGTVFDGSGAPPADR